MRRRAFLLVLAGAMATSFLPRCAFAEDKAPDYRYRLTVEVDTPEGVKTGSSVIEVKQNIGRSGSSPLHSQIYRHANGEAVAVDLSGGKTLFALLRSDNDIEWAAQVMHRVAPKIDGETSDEAFDNILLIKGTVELPRTFPPVAWIPERSAYPMMVTFGDLADPTSVAEVDPDDLAASFGEGVRLKRITVELTDDPVTTGIEERLGWLDEVGRARGSLIPNPPKYLSEAKPIDLVSPNDFSTELFK
jgi:hypothetical protein